MSTVFITFYINSRYNFMAMIRGLLNSFIFDLFTTGTCCVILLISSSCAVLDILDFQTGYILILFIFPCGLCCLFQTIYESRRAPFDNLEAESELVSGYTTDLSGCNLMLLLLTEYVHIVLGVLTGPLFFIGAPINSCNCSLLFI